MRGSEGVSVVCDEVGCDCGWPQDPAAIEAAERAQAAYYEQCAREERHASSVAYREAEVDYVADGFGRLVAITGAFACDDAGQPVSMTEADLAARDGITIEALREDFAEYLRDRDSDLGDEYAERLVAYAEAR